MKHLIVLRMDNRLTTKDYGALKNNQTGLTSNFTHFSGQLSKTNSGGHLAGLIAHFKPG